MISKLFPDILENQSKQLFKWTIVLLIINIVLVLIDPYSTSQDLTGKIVTGWDVKFSVIKTYIFGLIIFSLILSLIFSLIPYKQLTYGQKYFYVALIIYFALLSISLLFEVKNLWFEFRPNNTGTSAY